MIKNSSYSKKAQPQVIPHSSRGRWLCVRMKFSFADFEARPDGMRRKTFRLLLVAVKSSSLLWANRRSQQFCVLINYAKMIFSAHLRPRRKKKRREREHLFPFFSCDFPIYDLFAKQNNNKTIKLYDVLHFRWGGRSDAVT